MPSTRSKSSTARAGVAFVATAVAVLLALSGTAAAHVTVQPPEAEQGGFAKLTFRVPNELPDANTVGLRVQLPQDTPFAFVSVKPKAGWTYEVTEAPLPAPIEVEGETVTEAVSEISWTGGEIKPGEFDEFEVSVGPLPEGTDELFFPTIQIYSNGDEVAWIEKPAADGEEAELPAPELKLVAASGDDHHGGDDEAATAVSAAGTDTESTETAASTEDDHDSSNNALAIVALVVGGLAIVLSIIAIARRPKNPTASA